MEKTTAAAIAQERQRCQRDIKRVEQRAAMNAQRRPREGVGLFWGGFEWER